MYFLNTGYNDDHVSVPLFPSHLCENIVHEMKVTLVRKLGEAETDMSNSEHLKVGTSRDFLRGLVTELIYSVFSRNLTNHILKFYDVLTRIAVLEH
jgi:hypothetical protein